MLSLRSYTLLKRYKLMCPYTQTFCNFLCMAAKILIKLTQYIPLVGRLLLETPHPPLINTRGSSYHLERYSGTTRKTSLLYPRVDVEIWGCLTKSFQQAAASWSALRLCLRKGTGITSSCLLHSRSFNYNQFSWRYI